MNSFDLVKEMFLLQQSLNDETNGIGWESGYTNKGKMINWRRCIYMECAELMDSFGWKHWKSINMQTNWDNVRVEIVDIWHFIMSLILENSTNQNIDEIVQNVISTQGFKEFQLVAYGVENIEPMEIMNDIEVLIHKTSVATLNPLDGLLVNYFMLSLKCGVDLNILYKYYIGKNILNRFRQDNGYKEGTYKKIWNLKEDNVVMLELMEQHAVDAKKLYELLSVKYNEA